MSEAGGLGQPGQGKAPFPKSRTRACQGPCACGRFPPIPSLLSSVLESANSAPSSGRWLESTLLGRKHPRIIAIHIFLRNTHDPSAEAVHASQEDKPWALNSPSASLFLESWVCCLQSLLVQDPAAGGLQLSLSGLPLVTVPVLSLRASQVTSQTERTWKSPH